MARFTNRLDNVRVAAPCPADWDSMYGNERVRFCAQCQLNVYNISHMSRAEAERLIGQAEGRLCVRYYKRRDGSIITQNCPVGLRAIKRRLSRTAAAVASSVLSFFAAIGFYRVLNPPRPYMMMGAMVVEGVDKRTPPSMNATRPAPEQQPVQGKIMLINTAEPPVRKLRKPR